MPKRFAEIEYEILRILSRKASMLPMEIVHASDKIKVGSVYAYLARLKSKKWVRSFSGEMVTLSGMHSYRYSITGLGASRYKVYLADKPWSL